MSDATAKDIEQDARIGKLEDKVLTLTSKIADLEARVAAAELHLKELGPVEGIIKKIEGL
jgi:hypothetical protein